jgi:hypothetical protein
MHLGAGSTAGAPATPTSPATPSGSFSSAAAAGAPAWDDRAQCAAELQRLQAVQRRLLTGTDAAAGALLSAMQERRVLYERQVVLQCMEAMPRRQLHGLLQQWGIPLGSSGKKEALLQLLWQAPAPAQLSAATCKAVLTSACEPRVLGLLLDLARPALLEGGAAEGLP